MNTDPVPGRRLSIRIVRMFAMTLIFVCAGTLIQFALLTIVFFGYAVLNEAPMTGPTLTSPAEALAGIAKWAGLTGLIAGAYDATYDRVDARSMFVISLVTAFPPPILSWVMSGSTLIDTSINPILFLLLLAAWLISSIFIPVNIMVSIASMMACWKLIDIARDRIPAAGRLLGQ